jgi:hypothetical protein
MVYIHTHTYRRHCRACGERERERERERDVCGHVINITVTDSIDVDTRHLYYHGI